MWSGFHGFSKSLIINKHMSSIIGRQLVLSSIISEHFFSWLFHVEENYAHFVYGHLRPKGPSALPHKLPKIVAMAIWESLNSS